MEYTYIISIGVLNIKYINKINYVILVVILKNYEFGEILIYTWILGIHSS